MKKTTSLALGMALLAVAFCLFCTDNMWCAGIGTGCLLFAVIFIRYADDINYTQDEKRHRSNQNKIN